MSTVEATSPRFIVDELSVGNIRDAEQAFQNLHYLVQQGIVSSVGAMPRRYDSAVNYAQLSIDYKVPIDSIWGTLIGDSHDFFDQIRRSVSRSDRIGVLKIAAGSGLQSEPHWLKKYGDTRHFALQLRQQLGAADEKREMYIMAHQSMIAHLRRMDQLDPWIEDLKKHNIKIIRTNGWSVSKGRPKKESWDYMLYSNLASEEGYETAMVPDVFFGTKKDLLLHGLSTDGPTIVRGTKPTILYLSDTTKDGQEKGLPGKGPNEGELIDMTYAFLENGGTTFGIKVNPDPEHPGDPLGNIYKVRNWFDQKIKWTPSRQSP